MPLELLSKLFWLFHHLLTVLSFLLTRSSDLKLHRPHGSVVERVTSNDKVVSSILAVGSGTSTGQVDPTCQVDLFSLDFLRRTVGLSAWLD